MVKITPFLVSANRAIEYRTVSADAHLSSYVVNKLASWSTPQGSRQGVIYRRDVKGTPDGDITIFVRNRKLEDYRDKLGRNIVREDGICMSTADADKIQFNAHYLDEAERINDKHFKEFWSWTDANKPPIRVSETIQHDPALLADRGILPLPDAIVSPARAGMTDAPAEKKTIELGQASSRKSGLKGAESVGATRRQFTVGTVALGVVGVGLAVHGVISAVEAKKRDGDGHKRRDIGRTVLHVAEATAGAALTWAAYVSSRGRGFGKGL